MNDSKEFSVVLRFELHTMYVLRRVTRVRIETNWIESELIYSELIQELGTRNDEEAEARIA